MTYKISPDRHRLTIKADSTERAELSRQSESPGIQSDEAMHDWLESMVCNSELDWIDPSETGDLTSAPMLGIKSWKDDNCDGLPEVVSRWAFADYQVRSVLETLRDNGEVIFVDSF